MVGLRISTGDFDLTHPLPHIAVACWNSDWSVFVVFKEFSHGTVCVEPVTVGNTTPSYC